MVYKEQEVMSSREQILRATKENQPELVPLPIIDISMVISYKDALATFEVILTRIGGTVVHFKDIESLNAAVKENANGKTSINTLDADEREIQRIIGLKSLALETVDVAFIKGTLGVAENGSIWVDEEAMVNRLLPFICQHLVIVLRSDQIVQTMHQAYQQIDVAKSGFGSFIAGPSKTADIEQSLVIGAHGPRSMTLYLIR
jgi:L-lactate dehydrogenase complex protein LldG